MATPIRDVAPPSGEKPKRRRKVEISPAEPVAEIEIRRASREERPTDDEFLQRLARKVTPEIKEKEEKEPAPVVEKVVKTPRRLPPRGAAFFVIFFLFLIVALYGLGFLIARAEVTLQVSKNFKPFEFQLSLKQNPTPEEMSQGVLPLEVIVKSATTSKEYPATGQGEAVSRARGKIVVYNEFDTNPQALVERTRFLSPGGRLFRLTQRITVPGGTRNADGSLTPGSIEAEVQADQPGPEYNIGPARFSIPGFLGSPRYDKFYGVSKESFTGGARGLGKVVTESDIRLAEEDLSSFAMQAMQAEFARSLPENIALLNGATQTQVRNLTTSAKAGEGGDTFRASLVISLKAMTFDELTVREIIRQRTGVGTDGGLSVPTFDVTYELTEVSFSENRMALRVKGSQNVSASIDSVGLRRALTGKDEDGVKKQILTLAGVEEAKVSFWPFWVRRMPKNIDRITVRIN
jgi:hypothetical protein